MIGIRRAVAGAALAALVLALLTFRSGRAGAQEPTSRAARPAALLDVPYLPQSELLCGGAAAAMVLRYWGSRDVRPEDFRSLVRSDEGGIRAGELAEEVRRRGWRSVPFGGDPEEVRRQVARGRPVIALLEVEPGRHDFVVVVAWTDDGVIYHDPADSPFRVLSREDFEAAWEPTERWALLVLPSANRTGRPVPDTAGTVVPESGLPEGRDLEEPSSCEEGVRAGIRRARAGELEAAGEALVGAVRRCPTSARAWTELAGVRARQERWEEARELAEEAVDLDPFDPHPWRILATGRFLGGDRTGALAAWNRVGEPAVDRIRVEGMTRTPDAVVHRRLGLPLDRPLTPESHRRAARRLELIPAASSTRVGYRPEEDGRVEFEAAVLERALVPATIPEWAGILLRAAVRRELRVSSASAARAGELWTVSGRLEKHRPRVSLGVAVPDPPVLPGVADLSVGWERQSYRLGGEVTSEERRRAELALTEWITGRLRATLGAGVDRWKEVDGARSGRLDGAVHASLELRPLSDLLSLRAEGSAATALHGASGFGYGTGGLGLAWRSSSRRAGPVAHLRLAGEKATAGAPLASWPGAGAGRARSGLLRAHPLLQDGIVAGRGFGRALLHGGVEGTWWLDLAVPVEVGVSAFVDLARSWHPPGTGAGRLEIDAGAGMRLGVPGAPGTLQIAVAEGLRSGGSRIHVGWEAPWPGWARRWD